MFSKQTIARFHASYDIADNECWIWNRSCTGAGYGYMSCTHHVDGKMRRYLNAHRFSYIIHNDVDYLDTKELVVHSCDNPKCVNPDHLSLGTIKSNTREASERGLLNPVKGEDHGRAKLTDNKVIEMLQDYKDGYSPNQVYEYYGIGLAQATSIQQGKAWRHIPRP